MSSRRVPEGFQKELQKEFQKGSRRVPKGFQKCPRRCPEGFQKGSRRVLLLEPFWNPSGIASEILLEQLLGRFSDLF